MTEADDRDSRAGEEPDYRFTLANERTMLAWIRTSLAFLAGGIALREASVASSALEFDGARRVLAILAVALSLATVSIGIVRWHMVQSAMRGRRALPPNAGLYAITLGVVGVGVVAAAMFLR